MRVLVIALCVAAVGAVVFGFRRGAERVDGPAARAEPEAQAEGPLTLVGAPARPPAPTPVAQEEPEEDDPTEEGDDEPAAPDLHPDPVQAGPCQLALTLADDTPGAAPVETEVALWRLDAPGNLDWNHGDQLQQTDRTDSAGRLVLEGLPEGRYRLFVRGLRDGADDPPEFVVRAPETAQRVVLPMPRRFRVHLRLLDLNGRAVPRAQLTFDGTRATSTTMPHADWRVPRARRDGTPGVEFSGASGGVTGSGGSRSQLLESEDGIYYDLGERYREASRRSRSSWSCTLQSPEGGRASVEVVSPDPGPEGDRTYLGVAVPVDQLAARVLLPDGRRALDAGARAYGACDCVRVLPDTPPDAWRTAPITVHVTLDGYRPLDFVTDLAGPMPRWTMEPKDEQPEDGSPDPGPRTERRGEEALASGAATR